MLDHMFIEVFNCKINHKIKNFNKKCQQNKIIFKKKIIILKYIDYFLIWIAIKLMYNCLILHYLTHKISTESECFQ